MANLVENLAEKMSSIGIKASYGDPVMIGGVEVVPVAWVQFGFGGGSDDEDNAGGGGGGMSVPLGVDVPGQDGPTFRPNIISLLAVLIPVLWVGSHAIARVLKVIKK